MGLTPWPRGATTSRHFNFMNSHPEMSDDGKKYGLANDCTADTVVNMLETGSFGKQTL